MKLFGLIGYPLDHSFSKKYFTQKFVREGLENCRYELFPIENIAALPALLQKHPDLHGLNITIPYKQLAVKYLDDSKIPEGLSACNCIRIINGKLIGYNTDITGFEKSLPAQLINTGISVLILGNGGAAEAVKFVLDKLNISYKIVSRKKEDGSDLSYQDITEEIILKNLLIINTTPLGTYPGINTCPDIPYQYLTEDHTLFDLVYNPAKTLFLQKGEEKNATIINGEEMLVFQAEESWKIWMS